MKSGTIRQNFSRARSYQHASIWIGAVLVGAAAVVYARLVNLAQHWFTVHFEHHTYWLAAVSPFLFLLATGLVRIYAPEAKGSGIPQVLQAIGEGRKASQADLPWQSSLISVRTAIVKVFSSLVGLLGGASIGREGPTVQIAASLFAAVGRFVRKYAPHVELPSYLTAGAAAGVAAAFNTPVAGITFAIEEVLDGALGSFRQPMMLAVIISGMTAQAFLGDYLYFGHPVVAPPDLEVTYQSIVIGLIGGLFGGGFARALAFPQMTRLPKHWAMRAFICGLICTAIGLLTHGATSGSGYEPTEAALMASSSDFASVMFPIYKLITSALSYLSGMAGGIFSPSLSIGAGLGISVAKLLHFSNFKACALMGMVAFFSGVVQAPLTAVIIVTEMTDRNIMILPFMVAAFLGQAIGRLIMPTPLYHHLAHQHVEG